MADPSVPTRRNRRSPSPSSTSRASRGPVTDPRPVAAPRCFPENDPDSSSTRPRTRSASFGRRVERIRADLEPILTPEALVDSYTREAVRTPFVEAAYAIRWAELTGLGNLQTH